ncbi:hypothetical protein [Polyangium mundeleinium]|uniref:SMP-30/Gluconolactonase/LRE-like region domain-containing protein n=1 Tax=Polyangium mundeleinium TaxID=2995306 RepID=A0ABT5F3K1_9BACT|nr:hypothetical protein [Polyangium mundeleinium]MDC0748670.1 hypothetical protein [Polyangium mundeleinium]
MDSRDVAGLLLLTVTTACGARTALPSDGNGADDSAAGSASSSGGAPSCTLTIDAMATAVPSLIAEGERIYYVATEGRVMSADADTGATTLLAQIPVQALNPTISLALDADWLYFTFMGEKDGWPGLWRIPKAGGVPEHIASGRIDNIFVDETGLYWTNFLPYEAKHEVFRRRPDGTTLSLGVTDKNYGYLRGIFRGTAGLLVPSGTTFFAFDIDGAGATTISDVVGHISHPFERDGALFFNVDIATPPRGFFRASLDGTMAQQLYEGPFERVITDGVSWVLSSSKDGEYAIFGASYPDGKSSVVYHSPIDNSPRAVALTPTRLVLGAAWWEWETGIRSLCRDALGL